MYIYDISKHALSTDGHCEGGGDLVKVTFFAGICFWTRGLRQSWCSS